jgi:hypothetical protein
VETLQEEKGEEEFAEAITKGEFASQSKYDQEEEKVAVGAAIGAATDDAGTGFTDKDYSNYNPDEAKKEETPSPEEPEIDEDKLYKE